jgi:hypothetical protein
MSVLYETRQCSSCLYTIQCINFNNTSCYCGRIIIENGMTNSKEPVYITSALQRNPTSPQYFDIASDTTCDDDDNDSDDDYYVPGTPPVIIESTIVEANPIIEQKSLTFADEWKQLVHQARKQKEEEEEEEEKKKEKEKIALENRRKAYKNTIVTLIPFIRQKCVEAATRRLSLECFIPINELVQMCNNYLTVDRLKEWEDIIEKEIEIELSGVKAKIISDGLYINVL